MIISKPSLKPILSLNRFMRLKVLNPIAIGSNRDHIIDSGIQLVRFLIDQLFLLLYTAIASFN